MDEVIINGSKILDSTTLEHKETVEVSSNVVAVGTTATEVLSIPDGHTFYLRNLLAVNPSATATITLTISDSAGNDKLEILLLPQTQFKMENVKGYHFTGSVNAVANATGSYISIGGELTE